MTKIQPTCTANGSIHLKFASELPYGISTLVTFSVLLRIMPADRQPRVLLRLELPDGYFRFEDDSLVQTRSLGFVTDGQTRLVTFKLLSHSTTPANSVLLLVGAKQGGAGDEELVYDQVTFTVKSTQTTLGDVQATFLTV